MSRLSNRYINKHRRGVYFPDPEDAADCIIFKADKPEDVFPYLVEYHKPGSHNSFRYETFSEAQAKYMHICMDQTLETSLIKVARLRIYNSYHGRYITAFESRVFHPAGLYDTEGRHSYEKGKAPVSPRVRWRKPPEC